MTFRPFLRFFRTGSKVVVRIDTMLHVDRPLYDLDIATNDEIAAELLQQRLVEQFAYMVRTAREDAYKAGYRDGRAKRAKQTWQTSRLGMGE